MTEYTTERDLSAHKPRPRIVHALKTYTPSIFEVEQAIKAQQPDAEIWTIDPPLARWILDNLNKHNRPKKPANIKKMTIAMQQDAWRFTGNSLKFGDDKLLWDGQNRLEACIKSGKSFTTVVIFCIPADAFDAMDTGKSRSAADIFKLAHVVNYTIMASAAQWLVVLNDGNPLTDRRTRTPQELLNRFRNEWPGLDLSYTDDVKRVAELKHPIGMLVAMHYRFAQQDRVKADAFFRAWGTGINEMPQRGNPALVLRDALQRRLANIGRVHDRDRPLMMEHAWLAFRERRTLAGKHIDKIGAKMPGASWPTATVVEVA